MGLFRKSEEVENVLSHFNYIIDQTNLFLSGEDCDLEGAFSSFDLIQDHIVYLKLYKNQHKEAIQMIPNILEKIPIRERLEKYPYDYLFKLLYLYCFILQYNNTLGANRARAQVQAKMNVLDKRNTEGLDKKILWKLRSIRP